MQSIAENQDYEINIIIWAYDIKKAFDIAIRFSEHSILYKNYKTSYFTFRKNEMKINIYLRSPNSISILSPKMSTDILIIFLSKPYTSQSQEKEFLEAKKYFDKRKKIPFKIITLDNQNLQEEKTYTNLNTAFNNEIKVIPLQKILSKTEKFEILQEAKDLEISLQTVFKKFQPNFQNENKNFPSEKKFIKKFDLIKAAKELGENLIEDEANFIIENLDKEKKGKISYEEFKQWWILGRSDFINLRRICTTKISEIFLGEKKIKLNNYLNHILSEGKEISNTKTQQIFNVNFLCNKKSAKKSTGFYLEFCNGPEALDIIESKFEDFEKSEFAFLLKFKFSSFFEAEENLPKIEKFVNNKIFGVLNDIGSMLVFMEPIFKFKVVENFVCVYYTSKLAHADNLLSEFKGLIEGSFSAFSDLEIEDVLTLKSFEEICEVFLKLKIHFHLKMFDFKDAIRKIIRNIEEKESSYIDDDDDNENEEFFHKKIREFLSLLRLLFLVNKVDLDFFFDSEALKDEIFTYINKKREKNDKENDIIITDDDIEIKFDFFNSVSLIEFLLSELKAFYNELINSKENLSNFMENDDFNFLQKIDLNEIVFELQSKSFITPLYMKLNLQIPTLKEILKNLFTF